MTSQGVRGEMNLVAFMLSEVDKLHQCGALVFASNDFSSTTCSIKIVKYFYIFKFCCMFGMSSYPSLHEVYYCSAMPVSFCLHVKSY